MANVSVPRGELAQEKSQEWRLVVAFTAGRLGWYLAMYFWAMRALGAPGHFLVRRTFSAADPYMWIADAYESTESLLVKPTWDRALPCTGSLDDLLLTVLAMGLYLWIAERNRWGFFSPWFFILIDIFVTIQNFHGGILERVLLMLSMGLPLRLLPHVTSGSYLRFLLLTLPTLLYWAAVMPLLMRLFSRGSPWEDEKDLDCLDQGRSVKSEETEARGH